MRFSNILVFFIPAILSMVIGDVVKLGSKHGIITSPKFPIPYGDNIDRTWIISVRKGYRVHLYFTIFDLEDSYEEDRGSCVYDYVQVTGYKRLCGNVKEFPQDAPRIKHQVFRSESNSMTVKFVSDYSNEGRPVGFKAHYTEEDADECAELRKELNAGGDDWDQMLYCSHYCNNVPASYYCSCRSGYTLHSNKHTCVANCEAKRNVDTNGFLQSADYPQLYGKLSHCETTLQARKGWRIDVRFDRVFGIEEHYEEGCVYDWIRLTDDKNVARTYCGSLAPKNGSWIPLNTNSLRVFFKSDLATERSGYKLYYKIYRVKCLEVLRSPSNGDMNKPRKSFMEYQDRITFKCDRGFRMIGNSETTCDATGRWTSKAPTCQIKHCAKPTDLLSVPRIRPVSFPETSRPYNSSIKITCMNKWYVVVSGASEWFCDDDETWHWRGVLVSPNNKKNYPECRPYCGWKNRKSKFEQFFHEQILGGRKARNTEWPWMAFIDKGGRRGGLRGSFFCGGSLVEEQYIVTAAHCKIGAVNRNSVRVYLGVTDRFSANTTTHQVFKVSKIINHPHHVRPLSLDNSFDADIAVLKLDKPAVIGQYVRPICIPKSSIASNLPLEAPMNGLILGWGATEHLPHAQTLRMVRIPYVKQDVCKRTYIEHSKGLEAFKYVKITKNQFCAGHLDRIGDTCKGDSGGPLMWRSKRRWYLNGITSFATKLNIKQKCQQAVLGVYTNVTNFHDFLDKHIEDIQ